MAKSSNKSKEAAVPESGSTAPDLTSASAPGLGKPIASKASAEKPAKAKKRPKATGKRARAAAGKTAAARKPRTSNTRPQDPQRWGSRNFRRGYPDPRLFYLRATKAEWSSRGIRRTTGWRRAGNCRKRLGKAPNERPPDPRQRLARPDKIPSPFPRVG